MKTKTIGQCKDCKFKVIYFANEKHYACNKNINDNGILAVSSVNATFGCWYWKEKRKGR